MDTQFDNEDPFAPVDPEKEYYYGDDDDYRCKGFTRLMKLVLSTNKTPDLVDQIAAYLKFCPEELNKQNNDGYTALMLASNYINKYSSKETVEILLATEGVDPNIKNKYEDTVLMSAILYYINPEEIISILLNAGVDPNIQGGNGNTVLMYAINTKCSKEIVRMLIDSGADPNIQNYSKHTALKISLNRSSDEIVKMLTEASIGKSESDEIKDLKSEIKRLEAIISDIRNLCGD